MSYRDPFPGYDLHTLLEQRDQAAELRHLEGRVQGISDRVSQLSRRIDRTNARLREIEAKAARLMEWLKWLGVAGMMLAGTWDKLPEPLRQRLLGG